MCFLLFSCGSESKSPAPSKGITAKYYGSMHIVNVSEINAIDVDMSTQTKSLIDISNLTNLNTGLKTFSWEKKLLAISSKANVSVKDTNTQNMIAKTDLSLSPSVDYKVSPSVIAVLSGKSGDLKLRLLRPLFSFTKNKDKLNIYNAIYDTTVSIKVTCDRVQTQDVNYGSASNSLSKSLKKQGFSCASNSQSIEVTDKGAKLKTLILSNNQMKDLRNYVVILFSDDGVNIKAEYVKIRN